MANQLKKLVLSAFTGAGLDRLAVSRHAGDALVLNYHGILTDEKPEPFRYHHTVREFEEHLDWLARHCTPAGLTDFLRWKAGDWQPGKPVVLITFDDGYLNNVTQAAPLLKRKGFQALFFVASGYIGGKRVLWPDEVFARVLAWPGTSLEDPNGAFRAVSERQSEREALALSIVEACKICKDADRRAFVEYLARETPHCDPLLDQDAQAFMSWEDVRGLATMGFDIGSHTVSHPILSKVSAEQLRRELCESRATIEAQTGASCIALAYPNGRSCDIGELAVTEASAAGYDFAFTVSNRWYRRDGNPLQVDRISPPGHAGLTTFALHASGSRQWLELFRSRA